MFCCLLGLDLWPCLDCVCKITIKKTALQEGTFRSYGYLLVGIGSLLTSPKMTLTRINLMHRFWRLSCSPTPGLFHGQNGNCHTEAYCRAPPLALSSIIILSANESNAHSGNSHFFLLMRLRRNLRANLESNSLKRFNHLMQAGIRWPDTRSCGWTGDRLDFCGYGLLFTPPPLNSRCFVCATHFFL